MLGDLVAAAADGLQPTLARGLLVAVASALTRVLLDGGPRRSGPRAQARVSCQGWGEGQGQGREFEWRQDPGNVRVRAFKRHL